MSQENVANGTPSRPGSAALQNMKLLKKESTVFKVPKVPQKKTAKKSQVLEEDAYVEGIAKIIQRDFFPDLEKLKAQNEFLEATENKDYAKLREITQKYSGSRPPTEPYNSPATFDTPDIDRPSTPHDGSVRSRSADSVAGSSTEKADDMTDKHSLDSYLSSHTSEDNASYDRVIALEQRKRAGKLASQFAAEEHAGAAADRALALPSIEQQAYQTERPEQIDTWRYKARNYIMYVPDGAGQRPGPKPELRHRNTWLHSAPFDHARSQQTISEIAKSQGANVSGKIGVDGVSVSAGAAEYPYVATPSPRPGAGADQSPLMTWGEIEGTPFRLDGGDTPLPAVGAGAAYRMLEGGARERLALRLAEGAARRRRPTTPRTPVAPNTPGFRTNTERLASMSPAARKLAAKHLLSPRLKLTPNDMGILQAATPRSRTPLRTPRGLVTTPLAKKPSPAPAGSVNNSPNMTENNITDNLLQISVAKRDRLKASDFFQKGL